MSKRICSILIPYKTSEAGILVFLQKRAEDALRGQGMFGFFGGGAENDENIEQTLEREIQEELSIAPKEYKFFGTYESEGAILSVFLMEVKDDFELTIKVNEGEYGKFFDEQESQAETKLSETDKRILRDFCQTKQ
ncbi:MAG: NUDIX domain-containing protein [Patescibacteria group bacterium]|jgi:8-oxo-dGTP pyrophosphatase MutT (NUDIX family)